MQLYSNPLPSKRTGALFNSFPYPTKISPEAIAIYIACHTSPGDLILDPFAGSGTTGLATLLCDNPTDNMKQIAGQLGVTPKWGARNAILYELSPLGSFVAQVMCNPPDPEIFEDEVIRLLNRVENELEDIYSVYDENGNKGTIRYVIWSDILICPNCNKESSFWEVAVQEEPLGLSSDFTCPYCDCVVGINEVERSIEKHFDPLLGKEILKKKRIPIKIYGRTGKKTWSRLVEEQDYSVFERVVNTALSDSIPVQRVKWGDLYRKGYHQGISHIHHFYTKRNLLVLGKLWEKIRELPITIRDSIALLILSYNASHSTLMSRVVVKNGKTDFILTGAQSGVLYISSLPVEKNIIEGLRRKLTTFKNAFELVKSSQSKVKVINGSSTKLKIPDRSINYIFTDPPFGGYIPYAEINQINEAWLGKMTDQADEIVISKAQGKTVEDYGNLMRSVFFEMNRVLKDDGKVTLVFHSAEAAVWKALMDAYTSACFSVETSSVLDKIQGSFKQVTSSIIVKGDPLLLLSKAKNTQNGRISITKEQIIQNLLLRASETSKESEERNPERLYSRYIAECLEKGIPVSMNAETFYKHIDIVRREIFN